MYQKLNLQYLLIINIQIYGHVSFLLFVEKENMYIRQWVKMGLENVATYKVFHSSPLYEQRRATSLSRTSILCDVPATCKIRNLIVQPTIVLVCKQDRTLLCSIKALCLVGAGSCLQLSKPYITCNKDKSILTFITSISLGELLYYPITFF